MSACDRPRRRLTGATALVHASHLLPLLQDDGRAVVEGAVVAVLEQTAHEGNPLFVVDALDRAAHDAPVAPVPKGRARSGGQHAVRKRKFVRMPQRIAQGKSTIVHGDFPAFLES